MIRSMTAFARRESRGEWGTISWELRSVNHRFLELSLRLPEEWRLLEPLIRERLRGPLQRGKVEAVLRYQPGINLAPQITLNEPLAKQLARISREVDALLYNAAPVSSMDVLRWPGVLQEEQPELDALHHTVLQLLTETLMELVEHRSREGERIKTLLEQRLRLIEEELARVREYLPATLVGYKEKLMARLAEIQAELDESRLEQELVYLAQKFDVHEELDRLGSHVAEVRRVLERGETVGRRLDFLMQELHREANTLGAKSVHMTTTRASVELKVLIEQMREQIQTIE
jgi:uncharacterized protein (TIGR00255 family)